MTNYVQALSGLTDDELLEVRARERTFDGAYWRSALSAFGSGVIILRVFTSEFYKIGLVYIAMGIGMLVLGTLRRRSFGRDLDLSIPFKTSGNFTVATTLVVLPAYGFLLAFMLSL
ncbi:hypothetical protein K493DRAFT_251441 [Basidiobolus meristosporus CBS 931.73]|uniref:DUF202 domain-containing protein n=1 Tax=Basidiobolus meristosporus CBS 931.73 TaxID=1314790 RepID=A0A1Y1ZAX2_9FUNG|nr:hypothetical protein K493DRAFT_251441 [Basidiobolus meristosporus CBS 931.73]|eukprot:ORY06945.1 hypothetical protein K493DRAFT_251441 [Basidiobolus meristosporus CBS 931.73]